MNGPLEKFYKFNQNSGDFVSLIGHVGYPPPCKKFSLQIWMIQSMYGNKPKMAYSRDAFTRE